MRTSGGDIESGILGRANWFDGLLVRYMVRISELSVMCNKNNNND